MKCSLFTRFVVSTVLIPMLGPLEALAATSQDPQLDRRPVVVRRAIAMPSNQTARGAILAIEVADHRLLSKYFGDANNVVTIDQLKQFDIDFNSVVEANHVIDFADDVDGFKAYFEKHELDLVAARAKMKADISLQGFFTQVYIAYKIEKTEAKKDPSVFLSWIDSSISNPILRKVSTSSYTVVTGVAAFSFGIIYGATVAGPIAGFVGAFLEPMVRPVREKVAVFGSRLFSKPGFFLNRVLFANRQAAEANLKEVNDAQSETTEAQQLVRSMGYDMTPEQFTHNLEKVRDAWLHAQQVMSKTNPEAYRNGRGILMDANVFRSQNFAINTMQAVQGAEIFRQGIEDTLERIEKKSPKPEEVQAAGERLLLAVRNQMKVETSSQIASSEELKSLQTATSKARSEILALGATPIQADRLISNQQKEFAAYKHAATSLAASILHDFQYAEFNRAMPQELYNMYRTFRRSYMLDFFQSQFQDEVVTLLDQVGFKLKIAEQSLIAVTEAPQSAGKSGRSIPVLKRLSRNKTSSNRVSRSELNREDPKTPAESAAESVLKAIKK